MDEKEFRVETARGEFLEKLLRENEPRVATGVIAKDIPLESLFDLGQAASDDRPSRRRQIVGHNYEVTYRIAIDLPFFNNTLQDMTAFDFGGGKRVQETTELLQRLAKKEHPVDLFRNDYRLDFTNKFPDSSEIEAKLTELIKNTRESWNLSETESKNFCDQLIKKILEKVRLPETCNSDDVMVIDTQKLREGSNGVRPNVDHFIEPDKLELTCPSGKSNLLKYVGFGFALIPDPMRGQSGISPESFDRAITLKMDDYKKFKAFGFDLPLVVMKNPIQVFWSQEPPLPVETKKFSGIPVDGEFDGTYIANVEYSPHTARGNPAKYWVTIHDVPHKGVLKPVRFGIDAPNSEWEYDVVQKDDYTVSFDEEMPSNNYTYKWVVDGESLKNRTGPVTIEVTSEKPRKRPVLVHYHVLSPDESQKKFTEGTT